MRKKTGYDPALSRNEIDLLGELMRYETGQSSLSVFTKLRRLQLKSKYRYHVIVLLSNIIGQACVRTYVHAISESQPSLPGFTPRISTCYG